MSKTLFVLLVEDNPLNQKLIFVNLSRLGYKIDIVSNGEEAFQKVKSTRYDLVIMDLMMPVMDGLESSKLIREYESSFEYSTPIIGLTANTFDSDRERCIEAGMNEYMTKPFSLELFLNKIKKLGIV